MSVIRPNFLKVLLCDIERVGIDGACILALIRYVTDLPGEYNDRLLLGDEMWWRASYSDIGDSLGGISGDSVRRTMARRLEPDGELLTCQPGLSRGDRAKAYRIPPELPLRELARRPTSHYAFWPGGLAKTPDASGQNAASIPIEELGEIGEGVRGPESTKAHQGTDPEPPPCPKHPNGNVTGIACGGCRDARTAREAWDAHQSETETARRADFRDEVRACPDCDGNGMVETGDNSVHRCPNHTWPI